MDIQDFRPVTLEDRQAIMEVYKDHAPLHSDYSFTTMFAWGHYMDYMFFRSGEALHFMTRKDGDATFRGPIGNYGREDIQELLDLSFRVGGDPPLGVLDRRMRDAIVEARPDLEFIPRREYFDYVYLSSSLRDLPGGDFLKHRNQLNHFLKNNDSSFEAIGADSLGEAREFFVWWCRMRGCEKEPLLESEKTFIKTCMDNYEDLELKGIMVRIDGEIRAASVFEELSADTAVIHIEKADPRIKGLYQAVNQHTASILSEKYRFINRESDMGIPGLRQAKERYRPHHMVEVFQIPMAKPNNEKNIEKKRQMPYERAVGGSK